MKAYILSIAGVILIASVITAIAPGGKMGHFVKGMTRLFLLIVMVAPVLGLTKGPSLQLSEANYREDGGYLSVCADMMRSRDEKAIEAYLSEKYAVSAQVEVKRKQTANFDREKITVILTFQGIIGEDERINTMSRIREDLESTFGCETEVL